MDLYLIIMQALSSIPFDFATVASGTSALFTSVTCFVVWDTRQRVTKLETYFIQKGIKK